MPESIKNLRAVERAGAEDHFAPAAEDLRLSACDSSTPVARRPSSTTREPRLLVITFRLGRPLTGSMKARTVLARRPLRIVQSGMPKPSGLGDIEIRAFGIAKRRAAVQKCGEQLQVRPHRGDMHFPAGTVVWRLRRASSFPTV